MQSGRAVKAQSRPERGRKLAGAGDPGQGHLGDGAVVAVVAQVGVMAVEAVPPAIIEKAFGRAALGQQEAMVRELKVPQDVAFRQVLIRYLVDGAAIPQRLGGDQKTVDGDGVIGGHDKIARGPVGTEAMGAKDEPTKQEKKASGMFSPLSVKLYNFEEK